MFFPRCGRVGEKGSGVVTAPGVLALVGGGEWREGCVFDQELLEASGGKEVVVLPTAAAYEHPNRVVEAARSWFEAIGATVRAVDVLTRRDAVNEGNAAVVGDARFVYLSGGSALHLRSVLKDSLVWEALLGAWQAGAVVAGSFTTVDPPQQAYLQGRRDPTEGV
jgi:cyanophycinase